MKMKTISLYLTLNEIENLHILSKDMKLNCRETARQIFLEALRNKINERLARNNEYLFSGKKKGLTLNYD